MRGKSTGFHQNYPRHHLSHCLVGNPDTLLPCPAAAYPTCCMWVLYVSFVRGFREPELTNLTHGWSLSRASLDPKGRLALWLLLSQAGSRGVIFLSLESPLALFSATPRRSFSFLVLADTSALRSATYWLQHLAQPLNSGRLCSHRKVSVISQARRRSRPWKGRCPLSFWLGREYKRKSVSSTLYEGGLPGGPVTRTVSTISPAWVERTLLWGR